MSKLEMLAKLTGLINDVKKVKKDVNDFNLDITNYIHDEMNTKIETDSDEFNKLWELKERERYLKKFEKDASEFLISLNAIIELELLV